MAFSGTTLREARQERKRMGSRENIGQFRVHRGSRDSWENGPSADNNHIRVPTRGGGSGRAGGYLGSSLDGIPADLVLRQRVASEGLEELAETTLEDTTARAAWLKRPSILRVRWRWRAFKSEMQ